MREEELIGNTFVIVNDIRYVDKEQRSKTIGGILRVAGGLAGAFAGVNVSNLVDNVSDMVESVKGFKVKINTFLYRLDWNEEQAKLFYQEQYAAQPDAKKCANFDKARDSYHLTYVGKVESSGGNIVPRHQ